LELAWIPRTNYNWLVSLIGRGYLRRHHVPFTYTSSNACHPRARESHVVRAGNALVANG